MYVSYVITPPCSINSTCCCDFTFILCCTFKIETILDLPVHVFDNQIFDLQDQHMELYSCFLAQLWYVLHVYLQALSISNSCEYLKHILFLTCLRRQLNKSLFSNSVYSNLTSRLSWFALTINENQINVCDVS